MKRRNSIFFLLLFFIIASCTGVNKKADGNYKVKREDIIGIWKLTKRSYQMMKSNGLITEFELHADSSAIISFANSTNRQKIKGKWSWKVEKKIGNESLGVGFTSDIVISFRRTSDNIVKWGLQIEEKDNKITLNGTAGRIYEKM